MKFHRFWVKSTVKRFRNCFGQEKRHLYRRACPSRCHSWLALPFFVTLGHDGDDSFRYDARYDRGAHHFFLVTTPHFRRRLRHVLLDPKTDMEKK